MKKLVSIITVNYNGKSHLERFLTSVDKIDYSKDKLEVIVVDNGSQDESVGFVRKNFPDVEVIVLDRNLGFGRANNIGIKTAKGDLVFLVNNDTIIRHDAVKELVKCFTELSKNAKVGAINAKIVLFDAYLPIGIRSAHFSNYSITPDARPINPKPFIRTRVKRYVVSGTMHDYPYTDILLPIRHSYDKDLRIKFQLNKMDTEEYAIYIDEQPIRSGGFHKRKKVKNVIIKISKAKLRGLQKDLIQNAGNYLFRDGFGRDRGVYVIGHKQFYERDLDQYDICEEILAFCGAAVLLNKKALDKVGLFDDDFFMYYEDSELSLRLKQNGWGVYYCPRSLVRHIHGVSSKEWSQFFIYHVERGRLLFVVKHWPRISALKELLKYITIDTFGIFFYHFFRDELKLGSKKLNTRLKVTYSILVPFTKSLMLGKKLSRKQIKKFL